MVLDLEDSVNASDKESARAEVSDWLGAGGHGIVRVNAVGTKWHSDDLAMASSHGAPIMLPKAGDPDVVQQVRRDLGPEGELVALVESAQAVLDVRAICATGIVDRVAVGTVDLALDLGVDHRLNSAVLTQARASVVLACLAEGLPAPVDGITTSVDADEALLADIEHARELGFRGKLAIHPRQVSAINSGWTPTAEEIQWAQAVVAAAQLASETGRGVTVVDGHMVDLPVLMRARRVLTHAAEVPGQGTGTFSAAAQDG